MLQIPLVLLISNGTAKPIPFKNVFAISQMRQVCEKSILMCMYKYIQNRQIYAKQQILQNVYKWIKIMRNRDGNVTQVWAIFRTTFSDINSGNVTKLQCCSKYRLIPQRFANITIFKKQQNSDL